MTRTFKTARKTLTLEPRGSRVRVTRRYGQTVDRYAVTFRNRYALRRYLAAKQDKAVQAGYAAVAL